MIRTRVGAGVLCVVQRIAILAVGVAAWGLVQPGRAEAQWGMGYGGFWGVDTGQQTIAGINDRALIAGQAAFANRGNIMPSVGGPNSYLNSIRDPNFVDKVGISTRRGVQSQAVLASAPTRVAPAPVPAPAAKPVISLAGFFSRANKLIWPADAPLSGGLDAKRSASDAASLKVYEEMKASGVASVGSVAEARHLLIGYGQPALQYLRDYSTPKVADSFHLFLLSLYEALAQAGNPPAPSRR